MFRQMRADLASMWSPSTRAGNLRRVSAKPSSLAQSSGEKSTLEYDQSAEMEEDDITLKVRIPPFGVSSGFFILLR